MENENKMENEKMVYETPVVTKVEFDASDRITASSCGSEAWASGLGYCNLED